jgi:hypothetical protein
VARRAPRRRPDPSLFAALVDAARLLDRMIPAARVAA